MKEERHKIYLCKNCVEQLKEYNPYVDEKGETIPLIELNKELKGENKNEQNNNFKSFK